MRRVAWPLILVVLGLVGCGTGDDREQARAATQRFLTAVDQHDGAAACGELSEPTVKALEEQEGKACDQAVTELDLKGGAIVRVQLYLTSAKVDLASRQTAFLNRGPSGWKLSAVGCAHGAKPADHPYSCELED